MPFSFETGAGRYRDIGSGRFVPDQTIRRALDIVIEAQAAAMRASTSALLEGRLSLADWQLGMMQSVKATHLVGTSVAVGGWNQLDQSDFGWTGQRVRSQYAFLRGFAADIATGRQKLDGTALARATMYAESGRQTHRAALTRLARQRGEEQERNVLGASDHCPGCLGATAQGWVPIGMLTPCGSRNCLSKCHCHLVYRQKPAAMAA